MGAPVAIPRTTPDGFVLTNGHPTFISFGILPALDIWEKEVQPPGIDGGDPIDTTTMHNEEWRTMAPRTLKTLSEHTVTAAYDPCAFADLNNMVNIVDNITVHFPDNSTLAYWGFIRTVEFSPNVEGEQPEMTITVVPTNYDACNCVVADPVIDCAGTCTC